MTRSAVQTVHIRILDVQKGDVINKKDVNTEGWFEVDTIETLHDGRIVLADDRHQNTITGVPLDLVGLQLVRQLNVSA
ncbi:MAG: hypothetical protein OEW42_01335 [Acidimicrobiia bacterium]|nr:hypothetical protein [Acidimicrobiia bacterium]